MSNQEKWLPLLKEKKANLYFKPTRRVHDSGWRIFEVGYCTVNKGRIEEKLVLGECSDHIYTDYMVLVGEKKPFCINMDLMLDGYIRIWSRDCILTWDNTFDWVVSSAAIEALED
jgi:hypothetical protein